MNRKTVFTLITFVTVVVSGCAAYRPISPTIAKFDLTQHGAIIVSVQEYSEGKMPLASTFKFSNLETNEGGSVTSSKGLLQSRNDFQSLENIRGVVEVYSLPSGKYQFSDWLMSNGTGAEFSPRQPRKAPFTVVAGEIKYIGNINMVIDTGKNLFGIDIVAGGWPIIQDSHERDITIAKKRYAFLEGANIKKEIMKYE